MSESKEYQNAGIRIARTNPRIRGRSRRAHIDIVWFNFCDSFIDRLDFLRKVAGDQDWRRNDYQLSAAAMLREETGLDFERTRR